MPCGCTDACNCFVQDSATVTWTGSGTEADPLVAVVTAAVVQAVADTDCIDLEINEAGTLSADIILDPASEIEFTCGPNGLSATCCGTEPGSQFVTGMLVPFAGTVAPSGWWLCDGSDQDGDDAAFADLYSLIGTTYGPGGAGVLPFNVPDLRGRLPLGAGTGAGEDASGTGLPTGGALTARALGDWAGSQDVALVTANLAAHTHTIDHDHVQTDNETVNANVTELIQVGAPNDPSAVVQGQDNGRTEITLQQSSHNHDIDAFAGSSGSSGSGTAHQNMPPFQVFNYIIKL